MNTSIDGKNKKKLGFLTTFFNFDTAYSLCSVVLDQLVGAVKYGYEPVLFVLPTFEDEDKVPKGVEIRKIIPQLILEPYKENLHPDHWKEDVQKVKKVCETNMLDIDILICHDIFFIDTYLPYNIGLREAMPQLSCKLFSWTHSAPSNRASFEDNPHANRFNMPPGKVVTLNHENVIALAEMYGGWPKDIRVVHNMRDPRTCWNLDPFVNKLIDDYSILEADIISVYPLSTTRMMGVGKRLESTIKMHAKLKELGYKTCLIVPNAHANGHREKRTLSSTKVFASEQGLGSHELIFTSLEDEKYEMGVSLKIVSDLFRLSNVFIFPTTSENSSLVLAEAMLAGNLCVLNKKVGTLLEHGGNKAMYVDFDPRDDNDAYYLDLAKIVASEFEQDRALQLKRRVFQRQSIDYIWQKELSILFNEYDEKS